jgi:hypothetical protein
VASDGAKPVCNTAPTGSHIVDHTCTAGDAMWIGGGAIQNNQVRQGGISGK